MIGGFPISDEAVEAAARALYETQIGRRPWEGRGRVYKESWRQEVRTVIDAWVEAEGFEVERGGPAYANPDIHPAKTRLVSQWVPNA